MVAAKPVAESITMPDLRGMHVDEASAPLAKRGLRKPTLGPLETNDARAGLVLDQKPAPGQRLAHDAPVSLRYARSGPPAEPRDGGIDPDYYYRLTTQFRGEGRCLDVLRGGPLDGMTPLSPCADQSGQYGRLMPAGGGPDRLTTRLHGQNICLDVFNGCTKDNQPHLGECANLTGQL